MDDRSIVCPNCGGWMEEYDQLTGEYHCDCCNMAIINGKYVELNEEY